MSKALDKTHGKETAVAERRDAQRYAFVCPVEVIDVAGSAMISARTSDLSLHGCYIDTLNPLPTGTRVRLQLNKNNQRLELRAEVTACHVGGMGLAFEQLSPAQQGTVVRWLESTFAPAEVPFQAARSVAAVQDDPKKKTHFGVRLVQILERKGVLTHSEAAELLRELNS
jgi:PilZ domain-containing protein